MSIYFSKRTNNRCCRHLEGLRDSTAVE